MKVISVENPGGSERTPGLVCVVQVEVPPSDMALLDSPAAVAMAVKAASDENGPCRLSDKLTIIPHTATGPMNSLPSAEELKANPVVCYRRGFKCHRAP